MVPLSAHTRRHKQRTTTHGSAYLQLRLPLPLHFAFEVVAVAFEVAFEIAFEVAFEVAVAVAFEVAAAAESLPSERLLVAVPAWFASWIALDTAVVVVEAP